MPQHVAFAVLMLPERQHTKAFILLLVAFYHLWKLHRVRRGNFRRILAHFTSCEGSDLAGGALHGKILPVLPPVKAPLLLARHSSTRRKIKRVLD